jgi:hypothetical protein
MLIYISVQFPTKNRLPTLLIKVKACKQNNRGKENLFVFLAYQILCVCQASALSSHFLMRIGLDKPSGRAKGINHPKYSVEAEYACLKRESATS